MGGITSYLYSSEEEIQIPENERISYVTARDIRFTKTSTYSYYKIIPNLEWESEKVIPRGTYFSVKKIFKDGKGERHIIAKFDNEPELLDVSYCFINETHLIPRLGWVQDILTTSVFLPQKTSRLFTPSEKTYSKSY